jgi:DNA-binding IclR family transcriptional regulator
VVPSPWIGRCSCCRCSGRRWALGLAELAQRSGLYKSTLLRLLASLEHARLIQRLPDGRYALGSEIARLNAVYAASFSLEQVVMPALRELVRVTRESAAFHVEQGEHRPACIAWIRRSRCATISAPAICCRSIAARAAACCALCRRARRDLPAHPRRRRDRAGGRPQSRHRGRVVAGVRPGGELGR